MSVMPKVLGVVVVGAAMLAPLGCRKDRIVVHRHRPPERVVVVERRSDVVVHPAPRSRVIYVPQAPPGPRREVRGRRPGPGHVWIDGHWNWDRDRYAWQSGRWTVPPRKGATWEKHKWERRKDGWHERGGHWK